MLLELGLQLEQVYVLTAQLVLWSASNAGICTNCPAGTYQPLKGQASCLTVPSNSFSLPGAIWYTCNGVLFDTMVLPNPCISCHSFCTSCQWSPTYCFGCIPQNGIVLNNNECQCTVDNGFYIQNTSNPLLPLCIPCHNFCLTCTGPTNTECLSCVGLPYLASLSGTTCDCVENYYAVFNQITQVYECQTCHPLCAECFGALPSQCTKCLPGITYNDPTTCSCPIGTYYNTISNTCTKCDTLCSNCFGSQSNQCTSCSFLSIRYRG